MGTSSRPAGEEIIPGGGSRGLLEYVGVVYAIYGLWHAWELFGADRVIEGRLALLVAALAAFFALAAWTRSPWTRFLGVAMGVTAAGIAASLLLAGESEAWVSLVGSLAILAWLVWPGIAVILRGAGHLGEELGEELAPGLTGEAVEEGFLSPAEILGAAMMGLLLIGAGYALAVFGH